MLLWGLRGHSELLLRERTQVTGTLLQLASTRHVDWGDTAPHAGMLLRLCIGHVAVRVRAVDGICLHISFPWGARNGRPYGGP